jgi:hypothetical protein
MIVRNVAVLAAPMPGKSYVIHMEMPHFRYGDHMRFRAIAAY